MNKKTFLSIIVITLTFLVGYVTFEAVTLVKMLLLNTQTGCEQPGRRANCAEDRQMDTGLPQ